MIRLPAWEADFICVITSGLMNDTTAGSHLLIELANSAGKRNKMGNDL